MCEVDPAPFFLSVNTGYVFIAIGAGSRESVGGGGILNVVYPAIVAQFYLAAIVAENSLGHFVAPARFVPYKMGIVGGNPPVMPAAVRIGSANGEPTGYIRGSVVVGLAPFTVIYLVGDYISDDLGVGLACNVQLPFDLCGVSGAL